ncbi:helix-turn-helix domain-containing protein [Chromobacterium haemolyticum]|uniref:HTH cro/C1-type domain-containing protein n=1 Tax=Chromobacterium haemolyticum TaxID=394935 RepID=A0A1W0D5L8_9NEIS|nr:helix-turn-helix transcriptional regulator [Chromobacterium haemolyticum]OQS42311.1 hypothetical protein B0T45_05840 [Chromobacterium haemolyticum]
MEKLSAWRKRFKLTQKQAADLIGTTQSCFSLWETGTRTIPKKLLTKVSKVTGISIRQLLNQVSNNPSE